MSTKTKSKSKTTKFLEQLTGGPLNFSDLLSAIRQGEEMSHVQFAKRLGISRSHLCDIEKGRKAVSLDRAIEFAEILGQSKDQFVRLALQTQVNNSGLKYRVDVVAA